MNACWGEQDVAGDPPPASRPADERESVLEVMALGRRALLAGDAEAACGLLTEHARRRVLEFQVHFLPEGTPVPSERAGVPQTCEAMMQAQVGDDGRLEPWLAQDLTDAKFRVSALDGDQAGVRLKVQEPYGSTVGFTLKRTGDGWRIDDSDAVPSGY